VRLSRNRDFILFQAGQLLSTAGSSLSTIAYPLLVLALTGSPAQAGLVSFARLLPSPLLALPAGVLADRLDRRRIMLSSDAVRAVAMAALAIVVWRTNAFWPIPLLAFVEGSGDTFFYASLGGVLRSVVPAAELPTAVSVQQGRVAVVGIAGPPVGGVLFHLARALPFGVDALSYAFSFAAISAMRTPFQQPRERRPLHIRTDLAEGFRFLWTQPFLRASSFFYAVGNFTIPAFLFIVLVVARRHGLTGGEIGILLALFSVCILVGSLLGRSCSSRPTPVSSRCSSLSCRTCTSSSARSSRRRSSSRSPTRT
jgi:MFS family permease